MKTKSIVIFIAVAVALVTLFYSFRGSMDQSAYAVKVSEEREDKDRFMRTSKESPFSDTTMKYEGLKYFPATIKYKVTASLTPIKEKKTIVLGTNDGKEQRYLEYAYAEFDLDGYHNKLLILETIDGEFRGKLFVAFGDETSAIDTYGAGRYLDVSKLSGSSSMTLDFNLAYNPYCAYAEKYSCPFPPAENLLKIAINAGEKVYHE